MTNEKIEIMKRLNKQLEQSRLTIEKKIINAIQNKLDTSLLLIEVENLFLAEEITSYEYNFLTDIETLEEIYE